MSRKLFELTKTDLNVADFASTDGTRPLLTGVLVRMKNDRYELIATDSYRLVVHAVKQIVGKSFDSFIIPAEVLKRVRKYATTPIRNYLMKIEIWTDHIEIPEIGVSVTFMPIEGNYPDIDRLIDDLHRSTVKDHNVKLDPNYVAKTMKFFASINNIGIDITTHGKLEAVEFATEQTYAVVMPLKR